MGSEQSHQLENLEMVL